MHYENLHHLIEHSHSTRQYFLSLPVTVQQMLHEINTEIHTAEALHQYADTLRSPNCHTSGFTNHY